MLQKLWRVLFGGCSHFDEIVETKLFPSPHEQLTVTIEKLGAGRLATQFQPWYFSQAVVTVVRCKTCGRVKHIVSQVQDC